MIKHGMENVNFQNRMGVTHLSMIAYKNIPGAVYQLRGFC